jgi:TonB family protein
MYVAGLVKLGSLAAARRKPDEAEAFYAKAASLGQGPEVSPALLYLGMKAYLADDRTAAENYFQRILTSDPKGPQAGPALTWLAGVRRRQPGREAEVESLYQHALAIEDPTSMDTANTLVNYAGFLRSRQRPDEARELEARADQLRRTATKATSASNLLADSKSFSVGKDVSAPALILKVEPAYTEEARQAKIAGTVLLYVVIDPDGRASTIRVARSLEPGLDQKAIEAVSRWVFKPGAKDGMPVPVRATIEVNFRLL